MPRSAKGSPDSSGLKGSLEEGAETLTTRFPTVALVPIL